ncbi:MAG TPA: hypothetical protein VFP72_14495 [Kineosporiaceae bacterium]|nr:hypothetical protein [Kineosporiaceae bacterium]
MTRKPLSTEGHYSTWLWRWVCDRTGCKNEHPVQTRKHSLASPEDMQAAGWFVAKVWGDRCPSCVEAGLVPDVEPWVSRKPEKASPVSADQIRMPVTLTCLTADAAQAVVADAHSHGAPATVEGRTVTLPGDQPGFVIGMAEWAVEAGHATDGEAARCIAAMSDRIDESQGVSR